MRRIQITFVVALVAVTGCAGTLPPMPDVGVESTAEPLHVEVETRSYTYTTEEKAGEVVHKDSSGRTIGSSDVYVEKEQTAYYDVWFPMQGARTVDEADFYRIAGDELMSDEILSTRKRAHTTNRVGIFGGSAVILAGLGLMYGRLATYDPTSASGGGMGLTYAASGLALTGAIGLTVGYIAGRKLHKEHRFTDNRDAANAAAEYNRTLPAGEVEGTPISYLRR